MVSTTSKEQDSRAEFWEKLIHFRALFDGARVESATGAVEALGEAILQFGTCELTMRRVDRLQLLGIAEYEINPLTESAERRNERGIEALEGMQGFLRALGSQKVSDKELQTWRTISPDFQQAWQEYLVQWDISRADCDHFVKMMAECCAAVDREGLPGLSAWTTDQVALLKQVRQKPDRGTRLAAPIPWWKIVAVAIFLGMTAYAVWWRLTHGAPWWDVAGVIALGLIATALSVVFC